MIFMAAVMLNGFAEPCYASCDPTIWDHLVHPQRTLSPVARTTVLQTVLQTLTTLGWWWAYVHEKRMDTAHDASTLELGGVRGTILLGETRVAA
jgi:hypothetical protein